MGVSPVRFAVAASGALACLMLGLVAGVRAGSNQTAHVMSVRTVTKMAHGDLQAAVARTVTVGGRVRTVTEAAPGADAAARTVTRTVTRTVHDPRTVTETETVQAPGPAGPAHGTKPPKHKPPKDKPKPPKHKAPGEDGPGDGDGGGDGG
jgi:glucose/arabinose dehydrogenase